MVATILERDRWRPGCRSGIPGGGTMNSVVGSAVGTDPEPVPGFAVPDAASRPSKVAFAFAVAVTLLLAFRTPFSANISFGVALAMLAFPVTLRPWLSSISGVVVTVVAGLALVGGALL